TAEGLDLDVVALRPLSGLYADTRAETVDGEAPVDAGHRDRRAEGLDVELGLARHLDVEVGFDHVVVAPLHQPVIRVDLDQIAALRDLELDVLELIGPGPANRLDHHLIAGAAGDA